MSGTSKKFPPDHSTCKGYPWTEVKTEKSYPIESRFTKFHHVMLDPLEPNYVNIGGEKFMHKKVKELACKLIDAENYLGAAEEQIRFMQEETPFVPEEFGFECVARPESITEAPIKIYCNKYDSNYSMHKVFGSRYNWKLLTRKDDMTFDEAIVYFPCHRIAYAFFVAMDIQVEGEMVGYGGLEEDAANGFPGTRVMFSKTKEEMDVINSEPTLSLKDVYKLSNEEIQAKINSMPEALNIHLNHERIVGETEEVFKDDKYHGAPINMTGEISIVQGEDESLDDVQKRITKNTESVELHLPYHDAPINMTGEVDFSKYQRLTVDENNNILVDGKKPDATQAISPEKELKSEE